MEISRRHGGRGRGIRAVLDVMDSVVLKGSCAKVADIGDDVPLYFYSHLFLGHPEPWSMFPIQMSGSATSW
jgi:hypothetical protein